MFLTWNQQPTGDASETTSYRINRIRMNTGVAALNDEADDWQYVTRVRGVTSYTDSTDLRRDEETRMYQICSEASGVADPVCVEMPATYALHPDMHMPGVPQMVTAAADSDTEITVSWMIPADNGGSDITSFTVRWKQSDAADYVAADMAMADATASSHMVSGLMADTMYTFQVRATNAEGDSYWSAEAMAMIMATSFSAPTNVAATSSSGTVTVMWTPGALADSQIAIVVNANDTTDYCLSVPVLAGDASSYECTDRMVGQSYVVLVIALDGQGGSMVGNVEKHVAE